MSKSVEGEIMKIFISAVLFCVLGSVMSNDVIASPKVQLYSRKPGDFDVDNTLICHVGGFYPPQITIDILKNGVEMKAKQTDLAFEENWHFHLTKDAAFTPKIGEVYTCRVTHMGQPKIYTWEPDM